MNLPCERHLEVAIIGAGSGGPDVVRRRRPEHAVQAIVGDFQTLHRRA